MGKEEELSHHLRMQHAIDAALTAAQMGEVPVGAALFIGGELVSTGYNRKESTGLPTAHAEIISIEAACKLTGGWRLDNSVLYVTAEPCFMCAGAIMQARIRQVVFGVLEPKFGAVVSNGNVFDIKGLNHHPEFISGVRQEEIADIMKAFFKNLRSK